MKKVESSQSTTVIKINRNCHAIIHHTIMKIACNDGEYRVYHFFGFVVVVRKYVLCIIITYEDSVHLFATFSQTPPLMAAN